MNLPTSLRTGGAAAASAGQPRRTSDPIGKYFACLESAMNYRVDFEMHSLHASGGISRTTFRHCDTDALGAMAQLVERETGGPFDFPTRPEASPPSRWSQGVGLARYLSLMADQPIPALTVDYARPPVDTARRQGPRPRPTPTSTRAWATFCPTDTALLRVRARARSGGGNLNSGLLVSLHRAVQSFSSNPESPLRWSLPVNLRGPLSLANPHANHAIPLFLSLDGSSTPASLERELSTLIDRNLHWGAWNFVRLLGSLKLRTLERLIRRDELAMERKGHWFGIFSNLGSLQGTQDVVARTGFALTCPSTPVAAGVSTWNGTLALSLQVDSGLAHHGLTATSLLLAWTAQVGKVFGRDIRPSLCIHMDEPAPAPTPPLRPQPSMGAF